MWWGPPTGLESGSEQAHSRALRERGLGSHLGLPVSCPSSGTQPQVHPYSDTDGFGHVKEMGRETAVHRCVEVGEAWALRCPGHWEGLEPQMHLRAQASPTSTHLCTAVSLPISFT